MPTTLSFSDCRRQALWVLRQVSAFRGTMWEEDERQVAMMAMVEGVKACKEEYTNGTQARYIQQYVRGRLQSWREQMKRRHFEAATWINAEGEIELKEAPVDATQEADLEHREDCERVARAVAKMSRQDRETVAQMLDGTKKELEKGEALGLTPQGWGNRRRIVTNRLKELLGEGMA